MALLKFALIIIIIIIIIFIDNIGRIVIRWSFRSDSRPSDASGF